MKKFLCILPIGFLYFYITNLVVLNYNLGHGSNSIHWILLSIFIIFAFIIITKNGYKPNQYKFNSSDSNYTVQSILKKFKFKVSYNFLAKCLVIAYSIYLCNLYFSLYSINPLGQWDAYVMWNFKAFNYSARFLGDLPFILYQEDLTFHSDYPIFLPIFLSYFFILNQNYTIFIPIGFCILLYICYIIMIYKSLKISNVTDFLFGSIFILISFAIPNLWTMLTDQYADLPLAIFIMLGIFFYYESVFRFFTDKLLINISEFNEKEKGNQNNFFLQGMEFNFILFQISAGICFGLLPGIKNEGGIIYLVFLVYFLFSFIYYYFVIKIPKTRFYRILPFILSLLIVGGLSFVLKSLAPKTIESDFPALSNIVLNPSGLLDYFNSERISLIQKYFNNYYLKNTFLIPLISILLILRSKTNAWKSIILPLIAISFIYTIFFFFSLRELEWHLDTAFNRIHTQLIPSYILVAIMSLFDDK
ncbi:hypothetical protein [Leptospira sp. GIMC2001]|uniref:hypothetical protein n=1 Tax=Leptospira sp. GIMC2001 TaxID=1513297 RepID=UPI00234A4A5D|nr:hypothetical protein [Leptospira sp. GIMC2001]WCL50429.1 hypothetical protein O4O04_06305 [Leptospira sp. GIMC2001]